MLNRTPNNEHKLHAEMPSLEEKIPEIKNDTTLIDSDDEDLQSLDESESPAMESKAGARTLATVENIVSSIERFFLGPLSAYHDYPVLNSYHTLYPNHAFMNSNRTSGINPRLPAEPTEKISQQECKEMQENQEKWQAYFDTLDEITTELGCLIPYEFTCSIMKTVLRYPQFHQTTPQQYFNKKCLQQLAEQKQSFIHPFTKETVSLCDVKSDSLLQKQIIAYIQMFKKYYPLIKLLPEEYSSDFDVQNRLLTRDRFTQESLLVMTFAYAAAPTKAGLYAEDQLWRTFSREMKKQNKEYNEKKKDITCQNHTFLLK